MQQTDAREGHFHPAAHTKAPQLEKNKSIITVSVIALKGHSFFRGNAEPTSCRSAGLWIVPLRLDSVLHQLVHAALVDDQRRMKLASPHQLFKTLQESRHQQGGRLWDAPLTRLLTSPP